MSESTTTPDPATVEIVRNYLSSAANEMMRTLIRAATDTIIYEIRDFGISLYDADLNLIADSPGVIGFLGSNDFALRDGVEEIGRENLHPGDIVLMNYPYVTSFHTHDVFIFAPIFAGDELIGFGATRAHWVDLGAKDPAYTLDSTDIHQEGILFPPVKIYKEGDPDEELLEIIRYNSRMPNTVIGEMQAQIASIRTGEERLQQLHTKYGTETIRACIDRILDHGRQTVREAVSDLPNGSWSGVEYGDGPNDDGGLIRLEAEVTVDGDEFLVDYSGSADPVSMPLNVAKGLAETVARLCLKVVTTPDEDTNGGHFDPLEVSVPDGSILDAQYPAPTFVHWYCEVLIVVILKAMSKGFPERVPACSSGDIPNIRIFGDHPETGRKFVEMSNTGQGWGATHSHDGGSALSPLVEPLHKSNPVEVVENKAPVIRVQRLELIPDSGGPGMYRGGLGARRDYEFIEPGNGLTVRQKTRTEGWGIKGGKPGMKGAVVIQSDRDSIDDRVEAYVDNDDIYDSADGTKWVGLMRGSFEPGEVISNRAGGGGGYGDPYARDPKTVRQDVVDGYVSRESARTEYGVALTEGLAIDWEQTNELRSSE